MPVFKYFSADSAKRFFSTWALRITPPDQFNDPFEMCPPIEILEEDDVFSSDTIREEFAARMAADFKLKKVSDKESKYITSILCNYLLRSLTHKEEKLFLKKYSQLRLLLPNMRLQFEASINLARAQFPELIDKVEVSIHRSTRESIGALCMSLNGCHPLMWAHYADEHRGVVIEFDENSACFNRKRSANDEVGVFRKVCYSPTRPILNGKVGDEWFEQLALTKAMEWKYEEEVRFLLMLEKADRCVGNNIHLIDILPSAVRSVTFGCRATSETISDLSSRIKEFDAASNFLYFKTEMDKKLFSLNYIPIDDAVI